MKIESGTSKAGNEWTSYTPEAGDNIVCIADSVYTSQPQAIIVNKGKDNERNVVVYRYGISAKWDDKEIFCKLTEGQKKVLDKVDSLEGKEVVFEEYTHPQHGKLVGARVKK